MRRGRKDTNHSEIAKAFRSLGCTVAEFPKTDIPGWPDFCVGCVGKNFLVDAKNPLTAYGRAGLNANQTAFNRDWRGGKIETASTVDEVIHLVSKWRRS